VVAVAEVALPVSGDGVLWVMLVLTLIVVWTRYRPVLSRMLFTPGYYAAPGGVTTSQQVVGA
jgi:hypothetical protein